MSNPPQPKVCVFCGQIAPHTTKLYMSTPSLIRRASYTYAVLSTCKEHHKKISSVSNRASLGAMVSAAAGALAIVGIIAASQHRSGAIAFTVVLGVLCIVMAVVSSNAYRELKPYQDKAQQAILRKQLHL